MSVTGRRRPVVLYQPRDEGAWMPLGLLALGSQLTGEQVVLVDGRFELAPEAHIAELASEASCLGVSVRTGQTLRDALRVSSAARIANPRLCVVWGGPHATWAPLSCLATGAVDACALGAGEQSLAAAVRALRGNRPLASVPGLRVRDGGAVQPEPPPEAGRQAPLRYSLIDVERHFEARGARRLDYCSSRGPREGVWQGLPAERVLAETAELRERHQLSEVVFRDEDFFADAERAAAIVVGLAEAAGRFGWRVAARPQDLLTADDPVRGMAAAGCRGVAMRVAGDLRRGGALREGVLAAARRLHGAGIGARFELTLAEPGAGLSALAAAISLARALAAIDVRFETPLRRVKEVSEAVAPGEAPGTTIEEWIARSEAPWPDSRAEQRLRRAVFYFAEAQRPPRRRPRHHLLRTLSLLRIRLGFFGLDLERRLAEASSVIRTGRPRFIALED